jgi:hypothetical protein
VGCIGSGWEQVGNPLLSKELAKFGFNLEVALLQVLPSKEGNTPSVFHCVLLHNKISDRTRQRRVVVSS